MDLISSSFSNFLNNAKVRIISDKTKFLKNIIVGSRLIPKNKDRIEPSIHIGEPQYLEIGIAKSTYLFRLNKNTNY